MDGPLQYDAASVESVGRQKAPDSPVAGANVLSVPDLNTGNTTYKAVPLGQWSAVGLRCLRKPVNDLSARAGVGRYCLHIALTAIRPSKWRIKPHSLPLWLGAGISRGILDCRRVWLVQPAASTGRLADSQAIIDGELCRFFHSAEVSAGPPSLFADSPAPDQISTWLANRFCQLVDFLQRRRVFGAGVHREQIARLRSPALAGVTRHTQLGVGGEFSAGTPASRSNHPFGSHSAPHCR